MRRIRSQQAATLGEPNDVPQEAVDDGVIGAGKARPNLISDLLAPFLKHLDACADSLVWGHSARGAYQLAELRFRLRPGLLRAVQAGIPCHYRG